jgi:archaellum component FlaC
MFMAKKYSKEQFWKLYEKLPQELKDALFAEETGNDIEDICRRNKISENLGQIVDYVGQVLIGLLPPEEFQETLEKEIKLKKATAKKVSQEINRFIFYPLKSSLEEIYKMKLEPSAKSEIGKPAEVPSQGEKKPSPRKDVYREPVE